MDIRLSFCALKCQRWWFLCKERAWRQQFKYIYFVIQAGKGFNWFILLRHEFIFRGEFWRPSDRRSNSQINYRHQSEWEEPKQNSPLIEHLHFCGIKGKYSLWFVPVSAFRRGVGAYGGIKSSFLMHVVWVIRTCEVQETRASCGSFVLSSRLGLKHLDRLVSNDTNIV